MTFNSGTSPAVPPNARTHTRRGNHAPQDIPGKLEPRHDDLPLLELLRLIDGNGLGQHGSTNLQEHKPSDTSDAQPSSNAQDCAPNTRTHRRHHLQEPTHIHGHTPSCFDQSLIDITSTQAQRADGGGGGRTATAAPALTMSSSLANPAAASGASATSFTLLIVISTSR